MENGAGSPAVLQFEAPVDPYDQATIAKEEVKEEEPQPFQKIGPEPGNYTCEFCGKQYKYSTPSQEDVALHAPIRAYPAVTQQPGRPRDPGSFKAEANRTSKAITRDRAVPAYLPDSCPLGIYFERRSCSYFSANSQARLPIIVNTILNRK
ncbi:zinc finger protein 618-like isoform X2 [Pantherophis guttatus]|uniref:Zinc finger protein 618-like isoform X2 n=1 Tax=Pantherophis guttatus TaxID=94885 RepID=A0ABM3ZPL0_PANGU|nr:zinc finger protein 618-like isoform X2 [Pantherophis guttatus]